MQYDGGLGPLCCPLSSFDPPLILIPMSSNPNPMIDPKAARAWLEGHKGVRGAWGDWGDWGDWSTSDASGSSRVSRAFRALQAGDENWLRDEVAQRLSEHLQVIRLRPESWLHWRPQRSGAKGEALLRARYPQAQGLAWTGVDRPSKVPGPRKCPHACRPQSSTGQEALGNGSPLGWPKWCSLRKGVSWPWLAKW